VIPVVENGALVLILFFSFHIEQVPQLEIAGAVHIIQYVEDADFRLSER